jgi:hypothetical protein
MDETQSLALRALRELLDDPDRDDWDELLAANRELIKAIAKNKPMTRNNARIVSEYLREAGWGEGAIGAATARAATQAAGPAPSPDGRGGASNGRLGRGSPPRRLRLAYRCDRVQGWSFARLAS